MCRHLAYLGPDVALESLLFDAPHSLCEQARSPRHQRPGRTNPDGWGVAWFPPHAPAPRRYRSATAIWDDSGFGELGSVTTALVAAARFASPGSARCASNTAPFVGDGWLFSLNGVVHGFTEGFGDELRAGLSRRRAAAIEGDTDSEVLFSLVLDRLDSGAEPADALRDVSGLVRRRSDGALNLLLTDGAVIAATRCGNSLFVRRDDGFTVASEPLDDDPAWREVPDGSILTEGRR